MTDIVGSTALQAQVNDYYSNVLTKSGDLKTNACTTAGEPPDHLKKALSNVHDDVMAKYYGCGFIAPEALDGCSVLDLGCGAGRDVYVLAQLVGEKGKVVGIDMSEKQLETATSTMEWHMKRFGYSQMNTEFIQGYLEDLDTLMMQGKLQPKSFDVIVSNCVINLCEDKNKVLRAAFSLLKEGGEMYFSDVYASQRVNAELRRDPVLFGECLSGALYWGDFLRSARAAGFIDPRLVSDSKISIKNEAIEKKIGHIDFYSATYRLWKLEGLETECEDYGQAVRYKGTLSPPFAEQGAMQELLYSFKLDDHHIFKKGKLELVCGNTFLMLNKTRFSEYFEFFGDFNTHYGIFDGCGKAIPFASASSSGNAVCATSGGSCC